MQEEDEKSRASVNTNSYAAPIEPNVVSTENTENNIHPLLKSYCKPAKIVRINGSVRQTQTLRDTGAMQSLLKDTHNSEDYVITNKTTLLKGITTQTQRMLLVLLCMPYGILGHITFSPVRHCCLLYTSPSPRD